MFLVLRAGLCLLLFRKYGLRNCILTNTSSTNFQECATHIQIYKNILQLIETSILQVPIKELNTPKTEEITVFEGICMRIAIRSGINMFEIALLIRNNERPLTNIIVYLTFRFLQIINRRITDMKKIIY